jgi:glycosyltransferase involved in cell wall biosynthesis
LKILFLSFYYSPDLCAGSFRSTQLIKFLVEQLPEDAHIDVITTQPNRYSSYHIDAPEREESPKLTIHRVKLAEHKGGMIDQMRAYTAYVKFVLKLTRNKDYQLVYGTSSRLMTAVLSAFVARNKNAPLYLDIRDIFVDTMADIFPKPIAMPFKIFFSFVERMTINRARRTNLVSEGFKTYFQERYPNKCFTYFTNSISQDFIDYNQKNDFSSSRKIDFSLTVVYAGNIGEGQGLHKIIPELAKRLGVAELYLNIDHLNWTVKMWNCCHLLNAAICGPSIRKLIFCLYI